MSDMPKIELDLERAEPPAAPRPAAPAMPPVARPYAPIQAPLARQEPASYRTTGLRLAGLLVLFNFVLSIWFLGQGEKGGVMVGSLVVDGIIAPMLLLGKESVRRWALLRSVLGLLIGSVLIYASAADSPYAWVAVVLNVFYCGGLILVLTGEEPGLGQLVLGGAMSGVSLCLIVAALAFLQATVSREPEPMTAFNGRVSLVGFHPFVAHPHDLSPGNAAKFEEFGIEQAVSPAGMETIWLYHPKPGITMDSEKALRGAFKAFETSVGQTPTEVEPRAESHGALDGKGLSDTISIKGHAFHARMFVSEQSGITWMFLVLLPERRDPALGDRILDSIRING